MTEQSWRKPSGAAIATITVEGDERIVTVRGEVDAYSAPQLRECLSEMVKSMQRRIVVDLGDVYFMDSNGLGVLIASAKRLRQEERTLALRRPNRQTVKLLEITGLSQLLAVV